MLLIVGSLVGCPAEQKAPGGTASATPDGGKAIFDGKCLACHTIGKGDGVGPDLMGVTGRREKAWLVKWLKDPAGMLETDAVAKGEMEVGGGEDHPVAE